MAWTWWASYVERGVAGTIAKPSSIAFITVSFAFVAGANFKGLKHSGTPLDYLLVAMLLVISVQQSYFLTRAIRQLRNDGNAK